MAASDLSWQYADLDNPRYYIIPMESSWPEDHTGEIGGGMYLVRIYCPIRTTFVMELPSNLGDVNRDSCQHHAQPCDTMIFGLSCLTRRPKTAVPTYVWERLFLPCMLEAEGQAIQDANQQVTSAEIVEFILALVMLSSLDQERG